MDFKQIQDLIKLVNKSNLSELKIEDKDFKITLRSKDYPGKMMPPAQVVPQMLPTQPAPAEAAEPTKEASTTSDKKKDSNSDALETAEESKYITVNSPMIGTFYRSPGPDKDAFVKVGDQVDVGSVLCIIEAMKLFNEIESEVSGKIVKVLADDASPVEYDQPLFLVDPSGV